jgi:glutamate synthase domain-containing protein 2/glutamate synthase domain-containing protein 3
MPDQVGKFFLDLSDPSLSASMIIVHSRYSTNTFPTWDLAQPFRFIAHNGEINTLRGNVNWMAGRESQLESELFGSDIEKVKPVIVAGGSDSAMLDNVFELLVLSGRSLSHAMMMLVPPAWEESASMSQRIKEFYRYNACLMEPWDGPAAIAFTDGKDVGAILDRNGLRPARYIVTKSGMVVMASEVGVLDINPSDIERCGRLEPGKIFYIDTSEQRVVSDEEIKNKFAALNPFGEWINENMATLKDIKRSKGTSLRSSEIERDLKAFGYTREDLKFIIKPMAEAAKEPTGSMGNDTPHAFLSARPQLTYTYFKQLFAQVTNPPIDPIREKIVMSWRSFLGVHKNILNDGPEHCNKLEVFNPILTNEDTEKIRAVRVKGFGTKKISILFKVNEEGSFFERLNRACNEAVEAINEGYTFVILSDRGVDEEYAAIPALLACGAVHHHLVAKSLRTRLGIIIESGEPREVHHFALLFSYGADCINPYLAYEAIDHLIDSGELELTPKKAQANYIRAIRDGILKILSKMGISTLRSYRGAQVFEALGLSDEVIEKCFTGTASRVGGADFNVLSKEAVLRHSEAFGRGNSSVMPTGGVYQWKKDGEFHLWNPESIATLQDAVRNNDKGKYDKFADLINDQAKQPTTLRSVLKIKKKNPIAIDEVEPVEEIVKRFVTGAMSFGSISRSAHETIAIAMNRLKGMSNTGEGGEDPERFKTLPDGDSKRSAVKQVASGRFGVTTNYLVNADELQIKIAQGAKPGEGGQLPGHKVSEIIAKTRYTTPGVTLISPPPHHDIYSIEDLSQLIFDLKNVNPSARISVKLVSEAGVGTVAAGVAKGHADMILISGGDGGTGASPLSSIKHAGLPWELGLSETHQTLVLNDLRSRVRLQTDGQMRTGRDVAIAAMLGAEEFGFATAPLIVLGCVMLRHCHLNNCSVGVATQDEELAKRFTGKPEYLVNYFGFVAQELRNIMASLGIRKVEELVGRTDLLEIDPLMVPWKAKGIDYSKILFKPDVHASVKTHCVIKQDHGIEGVLDKKLIDFSRLAIERGQAVKIDLEIKNFNRAVGAMLSGELCKKRGEEGLSDGTIHCKFKGAAGQSFGAFLAKGITFELEGMANDYIGKGVSGGRIIVYPDRRATFRAEDNVIIGNTAFYGATSGEAYIRGLAGERFCIRNSGLSAVVEGVGDHACEYMTGGRVVVLGRTGRNFAAGMSGGIAYIYDDDGTFKERCNLEMVELEALNEEDKRTIKDLVINHMTCTGSLTAKIVTENFTASLKKFVKVLPKEYKRVLEGKPALKDTLAEASDG